MLKQYTNQCSKNLTDKLENMQKFLTKKNNYSFLVTLTRSAYYLLDSQITISRESTNLISLPCFFHKNKNMEAEYTIMLKKKKKKKN